jgi:peptidoglycan/LPS O-acetylase OafA/YrhL
VFGFYADTIVLNFLLGVLVGAIYHRLPKQTWTARLALIFAPIFAVGMILTGYGSESAWPLAGMAAAGLLISAIVAENGGYKVRWRPALLLGDASYSLYLTHPFVTQAITKLATYYFVLTQYSSVLVVIITLAVVSFFAVLVFRYIEFPMSQAARKLSTDRQG